MKTELCSLTTDDGLVLHGVFYQPDSVSGTVLIHVHGMGGNFYENGFLKNIAEILTKNGIAFCVFNNRGNGFITEFNKIVEGKKDYTRIGNSFERFEDCLIDIRAYFNFVKNRGYKNIHLSGHSLGAPKVAYYCSKVEEEKPLSVIFLSPSDMYGLVKEEGKRYEDDIVEAKDMVKSGKGEELMPKQVWDVYPISANTYVNLFDKNSKTSIFNFYDKSVGFDVLASIENPIFTTMGRKDDVLVIPIEEIMRTIKEKAVLSPKIEYRIIGDAGHDYFGYEQDLSEAILDWIKNN